MNQASLPYDNIEELAVLLQASFSGNNETIKHSQNVFAQMSRDPTRFLDSLMKIITSEKDDANISKIKKAAAIMINRFFTHIYDLDNVKKNKHTAEVMEYILENIVMAMFSNHVNPTLKGLLQQFISVMLHADIKNVYRPRVLGIAKDKLASGQLNDYAASYLLIKSVIEEPTNEQAVLAEWFKNLLEDLLISGNIIIDGVGSEIEAIMKGSVEQEKFANIYIGLEVLKMWTKISLEFIKRLGRDELVDIKKPNYLELIVDKQDFAGLLLKAIILQIPSGKQIPECLLSTSSIAQLDKLLNAVKSGALSCFEHILKFRKDALEVQLNPANTPVLDPERNKFFELIQGDGVKAIVQSLFQLGRSDYSNIEEGLNNKEFHECALNCLNVLTRLVRFPELYTFFSSYKNAIIVDICLPLIASTKYDLEKFKDDPQGFVNLTAELVDDENEAEEFDTTVKIQAVYLLRELCINIDGASTAIVIILGSLIEYSLISNKMEEIDEHYPKLAENKESNIIKSVEPLIRLEACLLVLGGIFGEISRRKDLMQIIDQIFSKYHEYFLVTETNPLIKCRMCLFLGLSAKSLFRSQDEESKALFTQYISFIINCAGNTEEDQLAVTEQANDSLLAILSAKVSVYRIAYLIPDILRKMITYLPTNASVTFFDVLHHTIKIYSPTIIKNEGLILEVLEPLVLRAKAEFESRKKDKGLPKLVLTKIWNTIQTIGEQGEYIIQYQDQIERLLIPLFQYVDDDSEDGPFDQDILNYVASTIKLTKRVSPITWDLFQLFPKIFKRFQGLITPLFNALTRIIVFGSEDIEKNPESIVTLVKLGIDALNSVHPDANLAGPAMAALYFQVLIQYVGIPNESWEQMLIACLSKFKDDKKGFLKVRLLGVILLAFLRNFEVTQAVLIDQNYLGIVIDTLVSSPEIFENHTYDRKIYLMGVCDLLTRTNADPIILNKLPALFSQIVGYLKYVQHIELKNAMQDPRRRQLAYDTDSDDEGEKKLTNKDVLRIFLDDNNTTVPVINPYDSDDDEEEEEDSDDEDDDEDDDDDDDVLFPTDKDEVNYYATHLISDIKEQDEFKVFRETIAKLKESNQQLLKVLGSSLPERKHKFLVEVVQSSRVQIAQNGDQRAAPQTQARKMVKTVSRKVAGANQNN